MLDYYIMEARLWESGSVVNKLAGIRLSPLRSAASASALFELETTQPSPIEYYLHARATTARHF